jgi:hypothetical protein
MFKRPVQPALQLRLRLGGTDVATAPRAFVIGKAGGRLAGRPSFVWRRVCDKLTYAGASDTASRAAVYPCRSEVFVRSALA